MLIEQRSSLRGEITIPGDKSISHRAVIFGSLAKGTTEISGFSMGEDCMSTIDCFRKMNVGIEILPDSKVRINGKGLHGLKPSSSVLNSGRSGTAVRLLLGVLAGQPFASIITRNESAIKKPVGKVVHSLRLMGANITGKEDGSYCPLAVSPSKLAGASIELSKNDTHIKSPLLIASLYAEGETSVIEAFKSRDHSELMLNYLGADIKVDGSKVTCRSTDNLYGQQIDIPGDITIASYFIAAGMIVPKSDVVIKGVGVNPTRTGALDVFKAMGANIELINEQVISNEKVADIRISSSSLNSIEIRQEDIPRMLDEIPAIIVAAVAAKGTTTIKGLFGNKIKDSNRIKALVAELRKMGAAIYEVDDSIVVEGGKALRGTVIDSYNDYSIAMATSIAGLAAEGETMVRKAQILDVVFPDFITLLNKL